MKKRGTVFGVIALLVLVFVSGFVVAATSCDVAAGTTHLISSDFTNQQSTARVLVHGEASGLFTDSTTAYVDCNVNNVEPKPLEKTVKARLTLSSTSLAYRADCYYLRPEKDTIYTVGASVDGVPCVRSVDLGTISAPSSGKPVENVNVPSCGHAGEKECTSGDKCSTEFVPDGYGRCTSCPAETTAKEGKCVGKEEINDEKTNTKEDTSGLVCLDGSKPLNGECPARKKGCPEGSIEDTFTGQCYEDQKQNRPVSCAEGTVYDKAKKECTAVKNGKKENTNDLPKLPEDDDDKEQTVTISITKKFTFIGVPFGKVTDVTRTCYFAKYYFYDKERNSFIRSTLEPELISPSLWGRGILVKNSENDECTITFKGHFKESQSIALRKGWNFISAQTRAFMNQKNIKGDCSFLSPFVRYEGKYFKEKTMKLGAGYFVKVKSDCTLKSIAELEDELPQFPE